MDLPALTPEDHPDVIAAEVRSLVGEAEPAIIAPRNGEDDK